MCNINTNGRASCGGGGQIHNAREARSHVQAKVQWMQSTSQALKRGSEFRE